MPNFVSVDYIRSSIDLALQEKPDIILMPGDFCNSRGAFGRGKLPVPDLRPYFDGLTAPDEVFGVLGNHDYWLDPAGVEAALAETPIRLIHNENVVLTRGNSKLAIVGTPDLWEGDIDLDSAFAGIDPSTPRVFMQHNPDLTEEFPAGTGWICRCRGTRTGAKFGCRSAPR